MIRAAARDRRFFVCSGPAGSRRTGMPLFYAVYPSVLFLHSPFQNSPFLLYYTRCNCVYAFLLYSEQKPSAFCGDAAMLPDGERDEKNEETVTGK